MVDSEISAGRSGLKITGDLIGVTMETLETHILKFLKNLEESKTKPNKKEHLICIEILNCLILYSLLFIYLFY